ncbi:NAD(P)/FAD-dependent oxidoreductase [Natronobacterium texcoconense]|uniref:Phytoene dehydrogenase-related protein n=1 Tax=Natronobacterium texcoconense TaxID=1095778 RepID=A0A1H0ZZW2_NATTX|nr:NAD(P)/FAD-dependent oxidoreductase [Natronobacterium texcoconense]SDQ33024.1 Phytoene dehydrogenase-related protein [Natronobacterium texcoconense]
MQSTSRAIVVGGGLAGLVATRHLAGAGLEVTLLERAETVGGRVRTVERNGFRFDRGFQVLFTDYPAVKRELDLDDLDLRRFSPGATIARPNHRSTLSDPLREPSALGATLFNPDVSLSDKLRVARLQWTLRRTDLEEIFRGSDESIDSYLRDRGFSDRFLENFVEPFYGGITLDRSLSTSKRVFEYTFRTLATGSIAVPAEGMGAIPAQLADRVRDEGATIQTGDEVESVSTVDDSSVTVRASNGEHEADAVVVATDPPTARDLTGVDAIPTDGRGCVTQYYTLPERVELETGKRLLLNAGDDGPNQIVPHSEVAPEYAPDDRILLSGTYLGEPDADDEELADRSRSALESWYPQRSLDGFEHVHTERVPFAQFDQPPGIHDDLPGTRDPDGPVYLAGDYTHWSSIQGAMESGQEAAKAVLEDLSR